MNDRRGSREPNSACGRVHGGRRCFDRHECGRQGTSAPKQVSNRCEQTATGFGPKLHTRPWHTPQEAPCFSPTLVAYVQCKYPSLLDKKWPGAGADVSRRVIWSSERVIPDAKRDGSESRRELDFSPTLLSCPWGFQVLESLTGMKGPRKLGQACWEESRKK